MLHHLQSSLSDILQIPFKVKHMKNQDDEKNMSALNM